MKEHKLLLLIFMLGCGSSNSETPTNQHSVDKVTKHRYLDVGDIPFDEASDVPTFELCNEANVKQYYVRYSSDTAPGYEGEKSAIRSQLLSSYKHPLSEKENGYLTIRFIVNCKGQTGRFRTEGMNFAYQPFEFKDDIVNQLVDQVALLDGWIPRRNGEETFDYYQYLTFKLEKGQITEILP